MSLFITEEDSPNRKKTLTNMEDDLTQNGRQPKWKTIKMEDNRNGRQQKWKTTEMEHD